MWDPALDTPSLAVVSAAAFTSLQLQDLIKGFTERPLTAREEALLHFPVCHFVDERIGCLFLDSYSGNPTRARWAYGSVAAVNCLSPLTALLLTFLYVPPCRPGQLWGLPNLLSNGYQGLVPRE
jgi:hypothetical protein